MEKYRLVFDPNIDSREWTHTNLDDFLYHTDLEKGTTTRDEVESDIYEAIHGMENKGKDPREIGLRVFMIRYDAVLDLHKKGELASIPPHPDSSLYE